MMPPSSNRDEHETIAATRAALQSADADPRVAAAMEEYLQQLEAGRCPVRDEFLARYPAIADQLAGHLEGLDFLHGVATQVAAADSASDDDEGTLAPSATLGDFRLIRQIGRGGMGVVYEAEQLSLGRRVAVKVLPYAAMLDEQQRKRFQNEARAAATLDHPHIVPVHFVGQERGVHFYAMHLIDGQSLAELIVGLRGSTLPAAERSASGGEDLPPASTAGSPLPATGRGAGGEGLQQASGALSPLIPGPSPPQSRGRREPEGNDTAANFRSQISTARSDKPGEFFRTAARLGAEAAEALDHAHSVGILHRDIKPGNLLIDTTGKLWVADFGFATIETAETLTRTGGIVGTAAYMSPEQALDSHRIDGRADVYSLGATLYELLTLRSHRWGKADPSAARRQPAGPASSAKPPARLRVEANRQAADSIPRDLETIVMKALQYDAGDRYRTAGEMAADLRAFIDGREIQARRLSLWQRQVRYLQRHRRWSAAALAASFLLIAAFATVMGVYSRQLASYAERLELALADAEDARGESEAQTLLAQRRLAEAEQSRSVAQSNERLAAEKELLARRLYYRSDVQSAFEHFAKSNWFDASRLIDRQGAVDGDRDIRGIEWHLLKSELRTKLIALGRHDGAATECVLFPDGRRAATAGEDGLIRIWDTREHHQRQVLDPSIGPIYALAVSPDGSLLAVGGKPIPATLGFAAVHLLNADSGRPVRIVQRHPTSIETVAFSADGTLIAAGSRYEQVQVSTVSGELQHRWEAVGRNDTIAFSHDSRLLLGAPEKRKLTVWNCQSGGTELPSTDWTKMRRTVAAVRWSLAGGYFAAAEKSGAKIEAFDAETGRLLSTTLVSHPQPRAIPIFDISRDGTVITGGDTEGQLHQWRADLAEWKEQQRQGKPHEMRPIMLPIKVDRQGVTDVDRLDDGAIISTHSSGRVMLAYPHRSASRVQTLDFDVVAAGASRDRLFLGSSDGSVRSYDPSDERIERVGTHSSRRLCALAVTPDTSTLATVDQTGRIEMTDLLSGERRWVQHGNFEDPKGDFQIALSGDRHRIARVGDDRQLIVWNTRTGTVLLRKSYPSAGYCVALNLSAEWVARGGEGLQVYEVDSGELLYETRGHGVRAVVFSDDNRYLAAGHREGRVGLFDLVNRRNVIMPGHQAPVQSVGFDKGNRTVVSAQFDDRHNTIRLWDARAGEAFGELDHPLIPGEQIGPWAYKVFSINGRVVVCSIGVEPAQIAIWNLAAR